MALPSFGSFFNTKVDSNDVKSHERVPGFRVHDGDTSSLKLMPQFINKNTNQDSSFVTPVPSPAESYTSWSSPSSSPLQAAYNSITEYAGTEINNIYSTNTSTNPSRQGERDISKNNNTEFNIEKHVSPENFGVSVERIDDSYADPNFYESPQHHFDHQQLPPTPPATPPDYSSEEILSTRQYEALSCSDESEPLKSLNSKVRSISVKENYHPSNNKTKISRQLKSDELSDCIIDPKKLKILNCDHLKENNKSNKVKSSYIPKQISSKPNHQCQECLKVFKTKSNLNQHRNIVHKNVRYVCDECGKSFTHSGYRYHKLTAHRPEEAESSASSDDSSVLKMREQEVKKFECEQCGKRFAQNSLLRKHVSAVHDQTNDKIGGARKFQCPYCPSQFKRKDHVDRHITHLHSIVPDAKLFECVHPNCGKRFQSAGRLQQHNKLHEDTPCHPCPICGKTILRKKNLSIHMITCHPNETIKINHEDEPQEDGINETVINNNNESNSVKASKSVVTNSSYPHQSQQKVPMKCLACDFTFIYPSKLSAHLSSYPDHCLIPPTIYKNCETKLKINSIETTVLSHSTDDCGGINDKDLLIIDDFINSLLCNKLN